MKQRPARHRRAGRKVFVNRKQSAQFYFVNRKSRHVSIAVSRVFGEFDGEDGHVVGRFVVCNPSEGGG